MCAWLNNGLRKVGRRQAMKTFHSANELGWVAFWIGFIIFLFAVFIPTVNRALNL